MPEPVHTRRLEIPMITREATVREINAESRVIKLAWTTGATVRRFSWMSGRSFDEVLVVDKKSVRLRRLNNGAPLLNSHGSYDLGGVIGVTERAWIESGEGLAEVRFAKAEDNEEADKFFRMVKDKIIRNVSAGYIVHRFEIDKNEDTGHETWRAVDWEPVEISLVGVGADAGAGTRVAPEVFACEIIERNQKETEMPNPLTAPVVDPAAPPAPPVVLDEAAIRAAATTAAIAGERTRASTIYARTRAANLPTEVADKLISDGVELAHVGDRLVDEIAARGTQQPAPKIGVDNTDPALIRERMEIALAARMTRGLPKEIQNDFTGDTIAVRVELTDEAKPFANLRILDMMAELARSHGHKIDVRQPANMLYDDLMKVRSLTTSDFPLLLAGASHRTLLAAYTMQQPTYQKIFARKTFKDFRPHNFLRVGDFPALLKKNEAGEFKYGSLGESGNSIIVGTYGRMVLVSRELIVNDDLGALSNLPAAAGRKAAQFANETAFLQFALNSGAGPNITEPNAAGVQTTLALWHTTHGNLAASGTAITIAAISAGRAALMKMTSVDGAKVGMPPTILLVSPDKLTEAEQIVAPLFPNLPTEFNPFAGKLEVVADANLTGNAWYLFVDPRVMETFVYGYLEGQEGPQYATEEQFTTLGVRFRVFLDFGAGALDFRGSYKNPGA